jgi:hypothetical protein
LVIIGRNDPIRRQAPMASRKPSRDRSRYQLPSEGLNTDTSARPSLSKSKRVVEATTTVVVTV